MSLNNLDMLEALFQERKSINEFSDNYDDEEYHQYNDHITSLAKPMLMTNLHDTLFVIKCISYFPHLYPGRIFF